MVESVDTLGLNPSSFNRECQFKSGLDAQPEPQQQPQRTAQPAMQILRPEAVNAENFYPRR